MQTVLEILNLATGYLSKYGVESPRLNAELMLAHILKQKRLQLYTNFERPLSEEELVQYREFMTRRVKFEPVQYILGSTSFYGLEFVVNKDVLIPRQETEILIEEILTTKGINDNLSILDIGTGSGNIIITLAKNIKEGEFVGLDISPSALIVAKENAVINNVSERINWLEGSISLSYPPRNFDIIVSNPPYVSSDDYNTLQEEIVKYEPKIAVTDNGTGYKFYELISQYASVNLNAGGILFFEIGQGMETKVETIMKKAGLINIKIRRDYLSIIRVIQGEKQ